MKLHQVQPGASGLSSESCNTFPTTTQRVHVLTLHEITVYAMKWALYGKLRGMFKVVVEKRKKTPLALIQIAGILAAIQACLQTGVRPSSDADRELSHDLSPRWGWLRGWRRKSLQVFINRGLSGNAELVNTCGMSGREVTQRGAASKENTAFTTLFSLCNTSEGRPQAIGTGWGSL